MYPITSATSSSTLRVFDAHCPHQGAHLGHGGRLRDGCVGCPFHDFYFDADGSFVGTTPGGRARPHMKLRVVPHRRAGQRIEVLV
jgi:phenylpropionate dioxygenase-like ring-hydroxylating dioxygenase large terminal subunit